MKSKLSKLLLPLLFLLFSSWLMVHTFGYDSVQKNILIARTVWSDFGSHIPLIRSFSMGDNFDRMLKFQAPEYPLFSGEPIRYHFLFFMLVGLLEKLGVRLDWALNIPSILGFTLLLLGIWSLAIALFKNKKVAMLSIIFFLFNGSLAFLKFFQDHPLSLNSPLDIIRATSFPAFGPWDGGMITAFWNLNIYTNQRHLAWGFAIGIWFLVWVTRNQHNHGKKTIPAAILWGVIIGILPYFHQPMLVVMAILMGSYFLYFPKLRFSLVLSSIIGLVLIAPQILILPHTNAFSWYPGYLIFDRFTVLNFLSFWFQNLGLHAIFIPIGFFFIPKPARRILFPLFLLFMIGNLFKFSMEVAANHKFFNFALILGNMISAYVIVSLCQRFSRTFRFHSLIRLFLYSFICLFIVFLALSGLIDFFVIFNDTKGTLADVGSPRCCSGEAGSPRFVGEAGSPRFVGEAGSPRFVGEAGSPRFVGEAGSPRCCSGEAGNDQTATWIATNTPRDAIFLNSSFLYHPASLAGRKVFMGWPYFAWSAGYDTYTRNDEMKIMYESRDPSIFCPLLTHHHISYITVEDTKNDPNLPTIDLTYFHDHFTPVFESTDGKLRIYQTTTLCH